MIKSDENFNAITQYSGTVYMRSGLIKCVSLIWIFLLVPLISSGYDWNNYHCYIEDAEGDVVYFDWSEFDFYHSSQRPDIDITSIKVIKENNDLVFTLSVKGRIMNHTDYSYQIYGDINEYDIETRDFSISYGSGLTHFNFEKNYTTINLTERTTLDGNKLIISVPIDQLPNDDINSIGGFTTRVDSKNQRSYIDSTEPIEEIANKIDTDITRYLVLLFFVMGLGVTFYFFFGRDHLRRIMKLSKRSCPNCQVLFSRKTKICPYCDIPIKGKI